MLVKYLKSLMPAAITLDTGRSDSVGRTVVIAPDTLLLYSYMVDEQIDSAQYNKFLWDGYLTNRYVTLIYINIATTTPVEPPITLLCPPFDSSTSVTFDAEGIYQVFYDMTAADPVYTWPNPGGYDCRAKIYDVTLQESSVLGAKMDTYLGTMPTTAGWCVISTVDSQTCAETILSDEHDFPIVSAAPSGSKVFVDAQSDDLVTLGSFELTITKNFPFKSNNSAFDISGMEYHTDGWIYYGKGEGFGSIRRVHSITGQDELWKALDNTNTSKTHINALKIRNGYIFVLRGDVSAGMNALEWFDMTTKNLIGARQLDGSGLSTTFGNPFDFEINATTTFAYIADALDRRIHVLNLSNGTKTILAGQHNVDGNSDGTGTAATFSNPVSITYNNDKTKLFVLDGNNHNIRQIVISSGAVTTPVGPKDSVGIWGFADGSNNAVRFYRPEKFVMSSKDTEYYITDVWNSRVRKFNTLTNQVTTVSKLATNTSYETSYEGGTNSFICVKNDILFYSHGDTVYKTRDRNY